MKHPQDELKDSKKEGGRRKRLKENGYFIEGGDVDWNNFKFPPPPGEDDEEEEVHYEDGTLSHFSSPKKISTWSLDVGGMFIIHPVQRKKIDLTKVNNKRKLIQLTNLIKQERGYDAKALFIAIDMACKYAWSMTLAETLAYSPEQFTWPIDLRIDELHDD